MKLYNELDQEQIDTAVRFLKPYNAEQFLPQVLMNMTGDLNPGEVLLLISAISQCAYRKGLNDYAETLNTQLRKHEKPFIDQIDNSRLKAGI